MERVKQMQQDAVREQAAIKDRARLRYEAQLKRSAYDSKAKGYKLFRAQRLAIGEPNRMDRARSFAGRYGGRALGAAGAATALVLPDRAGQGKGSEMTLARRSPEMARQHADHLSRRASAGKGVSAAKTARSSSRKAPKAINYASRAAKKAMKGFF